MRCKLHFKLLHVSLSSSLKVGWAGLCLKIERDNRWWLYASAEAPEVSQIRVFSLCPQDIYRGWKGVWVLWNLIWAGRLGRKWTEWGRRLLFRDDQIWPWKLLMWANSLHWYISSLVTSSDYFPLFYFTGSSQFSHRTWPFHSTFHMCGGFGNVSIFQWCCEIIYVKYLSLAHMGCFCYCGCLSTCQKSLL